MTSASTVLPFRALGRLATFVRRGRPLPRAGGPSPDAPPVASASTVDARWAVDEVVTADAPFAASSYARARLLRQLHAGGLLAAPKPGRPAGPLTLADPSAGMDGTA